MLRRRTFLGTALGAVAASALPKAAFSHVITPSFKLFDTHAHFYTNDVDTYPMKASNSRYGPEIMVAKAMRFPQTPKEVFAFWDECGIAKGCGVQYNSTYQTDNRYLFDIAKQYPDRIIPVVITSPTAADGPALLEKYVRENRISGVRWTGGPDKDGNYIFLTDAAAPAWEMANKLGLVVVLMPIGGNMAPTMKKVGEFAAKYPNVNIVLDHIGFPKPEGGPNFGLTPEHRALVAHKNVYYKYTTLLIEQLHAAKVELAPFFEHMVKTFGANQMVWGSDVGNTPGSMFMWVQYALESAAGLPEAQQKAVFFETANRIFVPGGRGSKV
ncbi:amidohydrolase family protein [Sphingobium nicotianae]|uniref:Amidohydrolase family protein n=1 Tax=Sphingobium nicotianae TaxID=2782607 RepID=A0A9X1IS62_9SPHN|nr:amidohydrolase family protein [Sphingobium nicotianae]MBT2188221.1 amidohydrolase family protein [Sphingobium nicotianae]